MLKGVSELLNKEGAGTGVQWETYYPFSVAETPLPYEIVDDLSSILYVTSGADTNTKLNKIVPDTEYTLHY